LSLDRLKKVPWAKLRRFKTRERVRLILGVGGWGRSAHFAAVAASDEARAKFVQAATRLCLDERLDDFYQQKGVEVLAGQQVNGLETREGRAVLKVRSARGQGDREVVADGVVAGIGIQPNVELARAAGLEVDNGIRVDASLRTSHPDIYAAGDVANFYNPALDRRLRVEHEVNANTMGQLAGQGMAGRTVTYDHLPFFYSDLFELGYEAVGEVDSRLETVADWKEPYREGVVYYLRGGRVRGVLLWNVWEQVDAARKLIAERGPFRPDSVKGRLPA
jgi:NADPH-dependent 2,4-dienoyl-CoA reductase/sulfur reductase-like enzyme